MIYIVILILCLLVGLTAFFTIMKLPDTIEKIEKDIHESDREISLKEESILESVTNKLGGYIYLIAGFSLILMLYGFYLTIQGTPYEGHFREWLNLIVRLVHITFGIAWIGASFYFVFLENSLNRTKNIREELAETYTGLNTKPILPG